MLNLNQIFLNQNKNHYNITLQIDCWGDSAIYCQNILEIVWTLNMRAQGGWVGVLCIWPFITIEHIIDFQDNNLKVCLKRAVERKEFL